MGRESRSRRSIASESASARRRIHKHQDSFCLVSYRCPAGHRERIYNNRDGAVPDAIGCWTDGCPRMMVRCDLNQDRYYPEFRPEPGTRVFVPLTDEELVKRTRTYVQEMWAKKDSPLWRMYGEGENGGDGTGAGGMQAAIEMLIETEKQREKQLGWGTPDLIVVMDEGTIRKVEEVL